MNIRRRLNPLAPLVFAALLAATPHLAAQQPSPTTAAATPLPVFDAVAIHQNKSASMNSTVRWGGDAFTATNMTLTVLLMNTYGLRPELMSGLPSWADSIRFDVNAKVSDPDADALKRLSREQRRAMIAGFLKERFGLRAHIETKTLPVYDLVIAKGGSKLKENTTPLPTSTDPAKGTPGSRVGSFTVAGYKITAVGIPMSMLAPNLAFVVERNVIDKTGLTGRYDINLKWTPEGQEGKPDGLSDTNAPDLFTALQEQLGLKLEPSKGPVDTLVVDHVEMPTEN